MFDLRKTILIIQLFALLFCAGATIVRAQKELRSGEPVSIVLSHSTPTTVIVGLARNQVASLQFDHRSTTVRLQIVSPSGRRLISRVAPTLWNGKSDLFFKAAESGKHRIIITTDRPGATGGTVTVSVDEIREFRPSDSDRLTAHLSLSVADELRSDLKRIDAIRSRRSDAILKYEEAVRLFSGLGDKRNEAGARLAFGEFLYEEFDMFPKAEEELQAAISIYDGLNDTSGSAQARVSKIFPVFYSGGAASETDRLIRESRTLLLEGSDAFIEGRLNAIEARVLLNRGNGLKAIELINRQSELSGQIDYEGRMWAEHALLSTATAMGDSRLKTLALSRSLKTFDENKGKIHPRYIVNPLYTEGLLLIEKKQNNRGLLRLKEVLSVVERLGRERQLAFYLREFGEALMSMDRFTEAKPYMLRSLDLYERVSPYEAQGIYNALGMLYLRMGEAAKAKSLFEKAVVKNRVNGDRFAEGNSIANLARAEEALGNLEQALREIDSAFVLGNAHLDQLYTRTSRTGFNATILRTYSEIKIGILHKLYEKHSQSQYIEAAFETQERTNARTLLEVVYGSGYEVTTGTDPDLLSKKNAVLSRISQLDTQSRRNPDQSANAEKEITKLIVEYEGIMDEIRRLDPRGQALSNPRAVRLSDVRDMIDSETAVIEYSLGDNESFVWVITDSEFSMHRLPSRKQIESEAKQFVEFTSGRTQATDARLLTASRRLSATVLSPVWNEISGFKRVLIVPDERLGAVPFNSLTVSSAGRTQFLSETHEIVSLPSVSTLMALRESKRSRPTGNWDKMVAVMADPVFDSSDERIRRPQGTRAGFKLSESLDRTLPDFSIDNLTRLPFTNVEARRVAESAAGRVKVLSGVEAKREAVIGGSLADYRILHFATHGFLNDLHPELSGLVLSLYDDAGRPQDGFLRAIDLYSLKLDTDLVVLSGCRTASGETMRSEGMIGVTRGFMYAGVPSVIATLWDIDDSATSHFMERFYIALLQKGMTPSAALRQAKLDFMASPRFKSPRFWAGFVLHGEYDIYFK